MALIEPHAVVREGLGALIDKSTNAEIATAMSAADRAVDEARATRAQVVVFGIGRPTAKGHSQVRALAGALAPVPVTILADYSSGDEVWPGIEAGARGFIAKACSSRVLVEGIRSVHEGHYYMGPLVMDLFLRSLLHGRASGGAAPLTPREHEVLRLISQGNTDREIGTRLDLSPKTIHTYRASVMRKLNVHNVSMLVRRAMDLGLIAS